MQKQKTFTFSIMTGSLSAYYLFFFDYLLRKWGTYGTILLVQIVVNILQ